MGHFLPFHPNKKTKQKQKLEKMKKHIQYHHFKHLYQKSWSKFLKNEKLPGEIIILHKCTKNHDPMLYCPWDMACDGCNSYFSFWAICCHFTPQTTQNTKISKKIKKSTWRYHFTKAESNLEFWGSIQNLYKGALWAKFYPKIPWHNTIFGKKGTFLLNITVRDSVWLPMLISFGLFLEKCIKNHDHMLYCPWDMAYNRCNCYFSFWANFCPFTP